MTSNGRILTSSIYLSLSVPNFQSINIALYDCVHVHHHDSMSINEFLWHVQKIENSSWTDRIVLVSSMLSAFIIIQGYVLLIF